MSSSFFCLLVKNKNAQHGNKIFFCFHSRYNCNRYNEDDAKAARDAQEVGRGVNIYSYRESFTWPSWQI